MSAANRWPNLVFAPDSPWLKLLDQPSSERCEMFREQQRTRRKIATYSEAGKRACAKRYGSKPMLDLTPVGPGRTVDDACVPARAIEALEEET